MLALLLVITLPIIETLNVQKDEENFYINSPVVNNRVSDYF